MDMDSDIGRGRPDIVVAGHICLDLIPSLPQSGSFDKLLIPGRLVQTGKAVTATGGAVSNTGLALYLLGVRTGLMGKVGDDLLGRAILDVVRGYGPELAAGMVVAPGEDSSYTVVLSPPGVDRIFLHCPGANDTFTADDPDYDRLEGVKLFHFGYPPLMRRMYEDPEQLARMFREAKRRGVMTSLDMAMPDPRSDAGRADWPGILGNALPHVDFFLPSLEEILFMLRPDTFAQLNAAAGEAGLLSLVDPALLSDLAESLLRMGTRVVCLKLGDQGLYLRTAGEAQFTDGTLSAADWAGRELWAPCFRASRVVGTTGAGDCTIAGFLAGALRGLGPAQTLVHAVAVGACNVEAADAVSGIVPWAEVERRMAAGWERLPIRGDLPGWRHDAAAGLWRGPHDRP